VYAQPPAEASASQPTNSACDRSPSVGAIKHRITHVMIAKDTIGAKYKGIDRRVTTSNENKMSDGGRVRASLGVEM